MSGRGNVFALGKEGFAGANVFRLKRDSLEAFLAFVQETDKSGRLACPIDFYRYFSYFHTSKHISKASFDLSAF